MSRPEVSLENYAELHAFHREYQPHPLSAWAGHNLMAAIYSAEVDFAEGARSEMEELHEEGYHFVISSNHYTDRDQFTLGSFVTEDPVLSFFRGDTSIPAKDPIYHVPVVGGVIRRGCDIMGAVAAQRGKDIFGDVPVEDRDPELVALQRAASESLKLTLAALLERGNIATFEEGERNRVNPRQIQPLKRGHVDMMHAIDPSLKVATMPIGIYYPETIAGGKLKVMHRRPSVYIGRPITERIDTVEKLDTLLRPAMQTQLNAAVEMVKERDGEESVLSKVDIATIMQVMAEERNRKKHEKEGARAA